MHESQQKHPQEASRNARVSPPAASLTLAELWPTLRSEAAEIQRSEATLAHLVEDVILSRDSLASALAARLSRRLARQDMDRQTIETLFSSLLTEYPDLTERASYDLLACYTRDAACFSPLEPLLFFKGFLALSTYRVAHQLWQDDRRWLALYLQSIASEAFAVDIHPAARIGCGILLDHATSFVVGETAIIEDDVSILHEVTLGGTGKECGDRHPIVRSGVLIGAGAKILGRVEIGTGAKIGAGSVVLNDVPAHSTVAGVPAVVVGMSREGNPAIEMNQHIDCHGMSI